MEKHLENKSEKPHNSDKLKLLSVAITVLLVVSTLVIFSMTTQKNGNAVMSQGSLIIAGVIIIFGIIVLKKNYREIKGGQPLHDERSQKIMLKAGYKAFLASIWWLLILSWLSNTDGLIEFRDPSQALGAGILGMAIIFGISWFLVSRRGDNGSL